MNENRNRVPLVVGVVAGAVLGMIGLLVVGVLAAGALFMPVRAASAQADGTPQPAVTTSAPVSGDTTLAAGDRPHIAVSGTGVVSAQPDILHLQVGVEIQNAALDSAQSEAAIKASAIISNLLSSGVDQKDISTAVYNIDEITDQKDNQAPTVVGFRVTQIYSVTLRDIPSAGKIIDSLVASGANRIYGLTFDFADPTAIVAQARTAAMNDAKAKAQQLASLGGVTLGAPLLIEENSGTIVSVGQSANAVAAPVAPPINAGSQQVTVQVSVVYGIQ